MNIGLDLQSTRGRVSGIGAYAQGLAIALLELRSEHRIVPLTFRGFQSWPAPAELARTQIGIPAQAWRLRLNLVHAPGFAPPLWGRVRRVVTVHDISVRQRPELLPAGPSRIYWRDWVVFAARRADCIITPSGFTADTLRACLGIPSARLRHIPYPPRRLFRPASRLRQVALRRRFALRQPYILGLGALEPRKDWVGVVRAFSRLQSRCDHTLVLAGAENVAGSEVALLREICRLGLQQRVQRLGYVPTCWLPALYSAADAFVFPETYAGYGIPVLEAMACGVPVITYANTALPEVAAGAALLVPPPYRPQDLADALWSVLANPSQREQWSRRGLDRVAQFSWPETARATMRLYEEVAC